MEPIGFLKPKENKPSFAAKHSLAAIISLENLRKHWMVVGETGSGKTSGILLPAVEAILSNDENAGVFVIDYKGNLSKKIKALAKKYGRLEDIEEIGTIWGRKINLLEDMTPEGLENFMLGRDPLNNDSFWIKNAINILVPGFKLILALNELVEFVRSIDEEEFKKHFGDSPFSALYSIREKTLRKDVKKILDIVDKTFQNLLETFGNEESLRSIYDEEYEVLKKTVISIYRNIQKKESKTALTLIILIHNAIKAIEECEKSHKPIIAYKKDDNRTLYSILSTIQSVIGDLARNEYCNENDLDIAQALEEGKIVIMDMSKIPTTVLPVVVSTLMSRFRQRFLKSANSNHIYCFFDEAQRILTRDMDIPMDTLREAKVSFMLLFQNSELMAEAIGVQKYLSLAKNCPVKIAMKGENDGYGIFG